MNHMKRATYKSPVFHSLRNLCP